jgi:hypothetical protein
MILALARIVIYSLTELPYEHTVITIVNYVRETFIVQATGVNSIKAFGSKFTHSSLESRTFQSDEKKFYCHQTVQLTNESALFAQK